MASVRSQLTFSGASQCEEFSANPFVNHDSKCRNCLHHLTSHRSEAVTEAQITIYLKQQAGKGASLVFTSKNGGRIYLGGSTASLRPFLEEKDVRCVVNCAASLSVFMPAWGDKVKAIEEEGVVEFLKFNWNDSRTQVIPFADLKQGIRFLHEKLNNALSVVVHCAQGRSRSTTLVCAYLIVAQNLSAEEAVQFCKKERPGAQPNENFMKQLVSFSQSPEKMALSELLNT
eukprot:TRINITY_DN3831_c0_g1_i1.p1 TRINITY_DN3831_c0_g1~~TRINITY_DN3831_c0_g1_i1.p1  ORF type:complete len:243 (+),score=34.14 TRINITY_DN3831_c0_g1_i1:42-731(+)